MRKYKEMLILLATMIAMGAGLAFKQEELPWKDVKQELVKYKDNLLDEKKFAFLKNCYTPPCCTSENVLCPVYMDLVQQLNQSNFTVTEGVMKEIQNQTAADVSVDGFCEGFTKQAPTVKFYKFKLKLDNKDRCQQICVYYDYDIIGQEDPPAMIRSICKAVGWMSRTLQKSKMQKVVEPKPKQLQVQNVQEPIKEVKSLPPAQQPEKIATIQGETVKTAPAEETPKSVKEAEKPLEKQVDPPKALDTNKGVGADGVKEKKVESIPENVNPGPPKEPAEQMPAEEDVKPVVEESISKAAPPQEVTISAKENKTANAPQAAVESETGAEETPKVEDTIRKDEPEIPKSGGDGDILYDDDMADPDDDLSQPKITTHMEKNKNTEPAGDNMQKIYYQGRGFVPETDPFYEESGSNFFHYFLFISTVCLMVYVICQYRNKILALLLEGRRSKTRGRKHTAAYRRLDTNLEKAISSTSSNTKSAQIIY